MKRIILTLILSTLFLVLSAQDVDRDRRIMERVMADSDRYSYASASHDTLEVAVNNAVALLASQIVTDVRVLTKSETHSVTGNDNVEERLFYDQVAETFTNVRLKDSLSQALGKHLASLSQVYSKYIASICKHFELAISLPTPCQRYAK